MILDVFQIMLKIFKSLKSGAFDNIITYTIKKEDWGVFLFYQNDSILLNKRSNPNQSRVKTQRKWFVLCSSGGRERARTSDLYHVKVAL